MFLILMIELNSEKYDNFLKIIIFTSYQLLDLFALWKASCIITVCDLVDTQKTKWFLQQAVSYGHVIARNLIPASVDTAAASYQQGTS